MGINKGVDKSSWYFNLLIIYLSIMKAVIVCNGEPPSGNLLKQEVVGCDFIIGADGGGQILLEEGITPYAVIGDLDSFEAPEKAGFKVIQNRDQETNDLEKALELVLSKEVIDCVILGGFGKHIDHLLKNLSVLQAYNNRFRSLVMRDEHQDAFIMRPHFSATYPVGTKLSLFPISGKVEGVVTKGLKYPLNSESLENGVRDGSSNKTIEERVTITYGSGTLIGIVSNS